VATDNSAEPESIELAVESFFAQTAQSSTVNPTAYQKLEEAKKTFSELNEPNKPADDTTATPQSLLYQSYISGRPSVLTNRPYFNNPLGNLLNSVA
jgi:hypothetical protein